jgi:hypothetical protein
MADPVEDTLHILRAEHSKATAILARLANATLHRPGHDASQDAKDTYQRNVDDYNVQGKEVQRIKGLIVTLTDASALPTPPSKGSSSTSSFDRLYKPPILSSAVVLRKQSTAIMEHVGDIHSMMLGLTNPASLRNYVVQTTSSDPELATWKEWCSQHFPDSEDMTKQAMQTASARAWAAAHGLDGLHFARHSGKDFRSFVIFFRVYCEILQIPLDSELALDKLKKAVDYRLRDSLQPRPRSCEEFFDLATTIVDDDLISANISKTQRQPHGQQAPRSYATATAPRSSSSSSNSPSTRPGAKNRNPRPSHLPLLPQLPQVKFDKDQHATPNGFPSQAQLERILRQQGAPTFPTGTIFCAHCGNFGHIATECNSHERRYFDNVKDLPAYKKQMANRRAHVRDDSSSADERE